MTDTRKRRWFQISLKGIFLLLTVVAGVSALIGYKYRGWQKLRRMEALVLSNNGYWEDQEYLDVQYQRVTKEQLTVLLKELKTFENQTGLNVGGTICDDSHLKEIAALRELKWLVLSGTDVTDEGLKHLAILKELEWIDLKYDKM